MLTVSVQPEREMPYLHFEFYQDDATVFTSVPRKQIRTCNLTTALHEHNNFFFPGNKLVPSPVENRMAFQGRDSPAVRFSTKKLHVCAACLRFAPKRDQVEGWSSF